MATAEAETLWEPTRQDLMQGLQDIPVSCLPASQHTDVLDRVRSLWERFGRYPVFLGLLKGLLRQGILFEPDWLLNRLDAEMVQYVGSVTVHDQDEREVLALLSHWPPGAGATTERPSAGDQATPARQDRLQPPGPSSRKADPGRDFLPPQPFSLEDLMDLYAHGARKRVEAIEATLAAPRSGAPEAAGDAGQAATCGPEGAARDRKNQERRLAQAKKELASRRQKAEHSLAVLCGRGIVDPVPGKPGLYLLHPAWYRVYVEPRSTQVIEFFRRR